MIVSACQYLLPPWCYLKQIIDERFSHVGDFDKKVMYMQGTFNKGYENVFMCPVYVRSGVFVICVLIKICCQNVHINIKIALQNICFAPPPPSLQESHSTVVLNIHF